MSLMDNGISKCVTVTFKYYTHRPTQISTWASGGPASSRISSKWLCPSTSTSFLYLPPDKDNESDGHIIQQHDKWILKHYLSGWTNYNQTSLKKGSKQTIQLIYNHKKSFCYFYHQASQLQHNCLWCICSPALTCHFEDFPERPERRRKEIQQKDVFRISD